MAGWLAGWHSEENIYLPHSLILAVSGLYVLRREYRLLFFDPPPSLVWHISVMDSPNARSLALVRVYSARTRCKHL